MPKQVIIMRAHSGAGKSTWIGENVPTAVVCSADHFFMGHGNAKGTYRFDPSQLGRAHKLCLDNFERALSKGEPLVVVDNTNIRVSWYKDYLKLASFHGYEVFQKCLKTRFVNAHGVPEEKVDQMIATFEEDHNLPHWID